jgi:hypothetical protein
MRRRTNFVSLLAGMGLMLLVGACGGSRAVTGSDVPEAASGSAVLQGSVAGASDGLRVVAIGTSVSAVVDEDGRFVMSALPSGAARLRFEGGGVEATLSIGGLQDGLVTSINVTLSGASAQLSGPASCAPTSDTFFSGPLEQQSQTRVVINGRPVDVSQLQKVWRGERRIQLGDLQVGEKVKVWGVLRGDGVAVADEIAALTNGSGENAEVWTSFSGRVESVSSSARGGGEVHLSCEDLYPTVVVAGRKVLTSEKTKFHWSDGRALDPQDIKVGQSASVEGWKKSDGTVRATDFKLAS